MARLIDLEEVGEADLECGSSGEETQDDRPNPNIGAFSTSLSCYPIVSQLASYLDLNTLHELSRTCRQFRANLLQHRTLLIAQALRCDNENADPAVRLSSAMYASRQVWNTYGRDGIKVGRITSGKVGTCARDLVGNCRRCQTPVCRNCILKSPTTVTLRGRHRRLCRTCMKTTLDSLTVVMKPSTSSTDGLPDSRHMARSPCTCAEGVWICQSCGQTRAEDTTYMRGWAWRTRYSACGGLGAGLGEGNEGVECGRGHLCLAAREVEHEIECDVDDLAILENEVSSAEMEGHQWQGSSYTIQETVGIGGKVKKKVKKRVLVGAIVKEYEDERVSGKFLAREQSGSNRSWCFWCERVIVGSKDLDRSTRSTESVASSSSAASA